MKSISNTAKNVVMFCFFFFTGSQFHWIDKDLLCLAIIHIMVFVLKAQNYENLMVGTHKAAVIIDRH